MIQLLPALFILHFLSSIVSAQQNYSGSSILSCNNNDANGPSPAFLYTCNGLHKSCQSFLIFNSQPPYNRTLTISNLTSSNPEELARINNVTALSVFPTGKEVIVPVNCFCRLRDYYEAETKYILGDNDTYFTVAEDTYQSLTTCDALKRANRYGELDLFSGLELKVPLRCACPTQHQVANGTKYLLTYLVNSGDRIYDIAARFKVSAGSILDANGLSAQEQTLFPSTTILIPLPSEPSSSSTIVRNNQPADFVPPPASSFKKNKSKRTLYIAVAAATTGGFLLLLFVILSAMFLFRKRLARFFKQGTKGRTKWVSSKNIREEISSFEYVSKVYNFKEIKEATENFSLKNRVKGCVFRGVFGRDILAVKKMGADASKEVNMLKKINHFNLIKLQGYCNHNGVFYLVFEYMENGSLREWLSRNGSPVLQSWEKMIQIALDIANGLQYLHNFTEPCYVHKDINSDNILLDSDLRAKIANFTLAIEAENEVLSSPPTSHVVGTRGYMAPEYLEVGIVTPKMDVYAFGVVLLELIRGKDSITVEGREIKLSAAIVSLMEKENAEAKLSLFIDPTLTGNSGKEFALELAKLSLACLLQEPARRPNMAEVVSSLLKIHVNMLKGISPSIDDSTCLER